MVGWISKSSLELQSTAHKSSGNKRILTKEVANLVITDFPIHHFSSKFQAETQIIDPTSEVFCRLLSPLVTCKYFLLFFNQNFTSRKKKPTDGYRSRKNTILYGNKFSRNVKCKNICIYYYQYCEHYHYPYVQNILVPRLN